MIIWIIQTGEPLPIDEEPSRPMRTMNLTDAFIAAEHDVLIWAALFNHQKKEFRLKNENNTKNKDNITFRLINSTGYSKNVSLMRLYDHLILAINFLTQVNKKGIKLPHFCFIGFPPIELAFVAILWCKWKKIKHNLDVKDLWPDYFLNNKSPLVRSIYKIIFFPYFCLSRWLMKYSDSITAPSNSYLENICRLSGRTIRNRDIALPLTSKKGLENPKKTNVFGRDLELIFKKDFTIFCFIGSLSDAFNFTEVLKATEILVKKGKQFKVVFCGEGTNANYIKSFAKLNENVHFLGWCQKEKVDYIYSNSDIMIAPYKNSKNFEFNVPNKIVDAIVYGLPIISTLSGEVDNLISEHKIGLTTKDNYNNWGRSMELLIENKELLNEMKINLNNLHNEKFSYDKVYNNYVQKILNEINNS